jgi:hypothetical protein
MTYISSRNKDVLKLVQAFGFNTEKLVSFKLRIAVDEVVTIDVTQYPTKEEMEKGAKEWEAVSKKYILKEVHNV